MWEIFGLKVPAMAVLSILDLIFVVQVRMIPNWSKMILRHLSTTFMFGTLPENRCFGWFKSREENEGFLDRNSAHRE
jgi:hypothetical protein